MNADEIGGARMKSPLQRVGQHAGLHSGFPSVHGWRVTGSLIRVAVVGCGQIARQIHLRVLARQTGVRVDVLADTDPQNRALAAQLVPHATLVATADEAAASDVDAVLICLPTGLHAVAALAVLRHRKHLYLEKPLATSLADGQAVLDEWQRAGVTGMIGFNYRFNPLFAQARELIRSGRIGEVLHVSSVFSTPVRPLPAWKQARATGGGVLLDLAAHHFDLLPWLLDRAVVRVAATVRSVKSEADTAAVEWLWAGGISGQSFFSLAAGDEDRVEITGTAGKLTVDRYRSPRVQIGFSRAAALLPSAYTVERLRSPGHEPSYKYALGEFVAALRAGRPASPDLADGFRSLQLVCAAEVTRA